MGGAVHGPVHGSVHGVVTGGHRRIDRILEGGYLVGLADRPLPEVRQLRDEADQEATDLSYLRRLLQARLELVSSEITRRADGAAAPTDMVAYLTSVLSDREPAPPRGSGRHAITEPSRAGESRRYVERLVSDALLTDLLDVGDGDLEEARAVLSRGEQTVSEQRTAVHAVLDAINAEIGRRYRDGEASVEALLTEASLHD